MSNPSPVTAALSYLDRNPFTTPAAKEVSPSTIGMGDKLVRADAEEFVEIVRAQRAQVFAAMGIADHDDAQDPEIAKFIAGTSTAGRALERRPAAKAKPGKASVAKPGKASVAKPDKASVAKPEAVAEPKPVKRRGPTLRQLQHEESLRRREGRQRLRAEASRLMQECIDVARAINVRISHLQDHYPQPRLYRSSMVVASFRHSATPEQIAGLEAHLQRLKAWQADPLAIPDFMFMPGHRKRVKKQVDDKTRAKLDRDCERKRRERREAKMAALVELASKAKGAASA